MIAISTFVLLTLALLDEISKNAKSNKVKSTKVLIAITLIYVYFVRDKIGLFIYQSIKYLVLFGSTVSSFQFKHCLCTSAL